MEFSFVNILTEHVRNQFNFINKIDYYLTVELKNKSYGKGVEKAIFGINCGGPLNDAWRDFETGTVIDKKYTKAKKYFELEFKLNFKEVSKADNEALIEIVKQGILKTYSEIESLAIKDFDIITFYKDLEFLLNDRDWLNHPEKYVRPIFRYKHESQKKSIPPQIMMQEEDFWSLIQESILFSNGATEKQLTFLLDNLSCREEKEILGFELTFRELIEKSYHYNVIGLLKVMQGSITDDSMLYFRCNLILHGKELFYKIIQNPNNLSCKINNNNYAEHLLSVTDSAYIKRFGTNTDKELPSKIASTYIDYNNEDYPLLGMPWNDNDFTKRYASLIKLYK